MSQVLYSTESKMLLIIKYTDMIKKKKTQIM